MEELNKVGDGMSITYVPASTYIGLGIDGKDYPDNLIDEEFLSKIKNGLIVELMF